jgi:IS30 family transposase
LSTFTDDDLASLEAAIDNRPRTLLDYASAQEVLSQFKIDAVASVALLLS